MFSQSRKTTLALYMTVNPLCNIILKILFEVIFKINIFVLFGAFKNFTEALKKQKSNQNILTTVCFQWFSRKNKICKLHVSVNLQVFSAAQTPCSKNALPFVKYQPSVFCWQIKKIRSLLHVYPACDVFSLSELPCRG